MKKPASAYVPTVAADVGEGRQPVLDRASAQAIADASKAAGFPVPPSAAEALGRRPAPASKPKAAPKAKPARKAQPKPASPPPAATDQSIQPSSAQPGAAQKQEA